MSYSSRNFVVWDVWCMAKGDEVHLYHLQAKRPRPEVPNETAASVGHAVSRDLINWEERAPRFAQMG